MSFQTTDISIDELIDAPIEDFLGRCAQADCIHRLLQQHGGGSSN